ncbi:hypothetical protein PVK06_016989 [Gossypium arboreum]|uniref:Uncharacterized protein n=1 Tax=Gossypium arboreum TaxID=29729 RepID=A0ABR0Q1I6_GOSAR|nr:hypothetical protein PVK06_016989 [Gossypium arboreum]
MHRLGAYKLAPDIKAEPEPELEPEQSYTHSDDSSYHPELRANDYFSGSSGYGYHSEFDIFNPVPLQYNTPFGLYPPYYSTLPGLYSSLLKLIYGVRDI